MSEWQAAIEIAKRYLDNKQYGAGPDCDLQEACRISREMTRDGIVRELENAMRADSSVELE